MAARVGEHTGLAQTVSNTRPFWASVWMFGVATWPLLPDRAGYSADASAPKSSARMNRMLGRDADGGSGLMTRTSTDCAALAPAPSVAVAVIVCKPTDSVAVTDAPTPSKPSRLDVPRNVDARSPSSASAAVPDWVTGVPRLTSVAEAAAVTTGGVFVTFTASVADAEVPEESVTRAVIVCAPTESSGAVTVAPAPRLPSRLDDQAIVAERSPSSGSLAVPVNTTGVRNAALVGSA